jgi:hypothetical protein
VKKQEEGGEIMKSTVSATWERKTDNDAEFSKREKRPKVAAIEIEVQEKRRIWQNESEEKNF